MAAFCESRLVGDFVECGVKPRVSKLRHHGGTMLPGFADLNLQAGCLFLIAFSQLEFHCSAKRRRTSKVALRLVRADSLWRRLLRSR
jgi:hypothetical protein